MGENRYTESARRLVDEIDRESIGLGLVVTAARQSQLVAEALGVAWPGSLVAPLADALTAQVGRVRIATLPADADEARAVLVALNESRQRVAAAGVLVVLSVTRTELMLVQRFAADSYSTVAFTERCELVPDVSVDYDSARRELGRWYRARFGQLDLRGFIRAESEDVSWRIEDVYQELEAEPWGSRDQLAHDYRGRASLFMQLTESFLPPMPRAVWLDTSPAACAVLLGHPGSGKTFFLRWLALHAIECAQVFGLHAPLPLLVSLAAYARASRTIDLREYIADMLLEGEQPAAHLIDQAVAQKQALFLLDGLDEVGDEAGRRHVAQAVRDLARSAPGCLLVATSRVTGYSEAPLSGPHWLVSPLSDEAIESFLIRWCELYARDLHGPNAAEHGRDEGERLVADVKDKPEIQALARTPLLLTVLALVHRTGVRLPDHRVELYSHATQVLVERWNQVRSLSGIRATIPIKTADAVRLLGPVALEMIRSGVRGAIPEEYLQRSLERSLQAGHLRTLTTADEAIRLFQRSLGLLVEQGPGLYAFLHLTLAEYFAARELVRTGELEALVSDPRQAFAAEWREVILLAAGELGVIRADDARLEQMVSTLVSASRRRPGKPSPVVPAVLAGLLADDPGLSSSSAEVLAQALVPTWWFERRYGRESLRNVLAEFASCTNRIARGRFAPLLRRRMSEHYADRLPDSIVDSLARLDGYELGLIAFSFYLLDVDNSGLFFDLCRRQAQGLSWNVRTWPCVREQNSTHLPLGRGIVTEVIRGTLKLDVKAVVTSDSHYVEHWDCEMAWHQAIDVPGAPYLAVPFTVRRRSTDSPTPASELDHWNLYIASCSYEAIP